METLSQPVYCTSKHSPVLAASLFFMVKWMLKEKQLNASPTFAAAQTFTTDDDDEYF